MKHSIKIFQALILALVLFSCQESETPENLIEQVSFEGTLPDGGSFGTTEFRAGNGTGISGVNGKFDGRHILNVKTLDRKWSINLESPSKALPNDAPRGESVPFQQMVDYFNKHYPYEDLLQIFKTEKSKADANATYTSFSQFRIQLSNNEKFFSYLPENFIPSKGGKVRVLAVEEGVMKNLAGQNVRKIEVVIEFDLPMKTLDPNVKVQEGNLKGTGRFRYREDFFQGDL